VINIVEHNFTDTVKVISGLLLNL